MKRYIVDILTLTLLLSFTLVSCKESHSDVKGSGPTPEVSYVRPCDAELSDSLIVSAYLGEQIAIIGNHLEGVNAIYFNDQKAKLNPNFVTSNSIIVNVPSGIPALKEDLIKLCTAAKDTVLFTFETKVPAPITKSMKCEYVPDGEVAEISGLYFVDDEGVPLEVIFPGGKKGEVISSTLNNIQVKVPAGAEEGPIKVKSVYGTSESDFHFRDQRNIILDFDTLFPDGGYHHGWHAGAGYGTEGGINGQYLIFSGEMEDNKWDDSKFGYERWTMRPDDPDFFDTSNLEDYVLKFEVNVVEPWSSSALQVIFTGAEEVWNNWHDSDVENGTHGGNAYVSDPSYPRALWNPWKETGSFTSDGWITVTIPLTDFKYNAQGEEVAPKGIGHYSGITLFVFGGGVSGTPCTPTIYFDNVRVVKANSKID